METLESSDPDIAGIVAREEERQRNEINLIASENIVSDAILTAQGSVLTNKYAEVFQTHCGDEETLTVIQET